ncbi:hypothetical protein [Ligilactobacillus ceti]|uniref:Uncharacterized protein n=1 Tax=Ligilactobacillus ceti DSM 22408 TaxID=1122146 RepID=A0A0R2KHS7_9LACO|nr:hypothetical protein [Ligilactobacillus ceti]KRN88827.1 hypothetical protein IV53_GL000797 [Ligilactobacillus ceti DSM 22408]
MKLKQTLALIGFSCLISLTSLLNSHVQAQSLLLAAKTSDQAKKGGLIIGIFIILIVISLIAGRKKKQ